MPPSNPHRESEAEAIPVDESLIDAMLALSPEERVRHNDRMLRTILRLRQGLAEKAGVDGRNC